MLNARTATSILGTLLVLVHIGLWFGKGSVPHVWSQRAQLVQLRAQIDTAQARNQRIAAEVLDLRAGLDMIEEKARSELGMVKPDEIFVQVTPARR
ncbi:MAG: septum formation initiator family protein [Ideonella sp.]|nr:septum formation initiator family protein [Ideonella sp.]MCC7457455.1 septum formation initiator family protein [Nitrospira sp.]